MNTDIPTEPMGARDVAATLLGSWYLLLFVPLVAAALIAALFSVLPETYSSSVRLDLGHFASDLEPDSQVLAVAAARPDSDKETAGLDLSAFLSAVTIERLPDGSVQITTSAGNPEVARGIARDVVAAIVEMSRPSERAMSELLATEAGLKVSIARMERAIELLSAHLNTAAGRILDPADAAGASEATVILSRGIADETRRLAEVQYLLTGPTEHILGSSPTPATKVQRELVRPTAVAFLLVLICTFGYVLLFRRRNV